jgi:hypothetical protein
MMVLHIAVSCLCAGWSIGSMRYNRLVEHNSADYDRF